MQCTAVAVVVESSHRDFAELRVFFVRAFPFEAAPSVWSALVEKDEHLFIVTNQVIILL